MGSSRDNRIIAFAVTPAQNVPVAFSRTDNTHATIKPEACIFVNDADALYRLAYTGIGLAIVPDFLARDNVDAGSMKYVLPDWELHTIKIFAVWPANPPKHGLIHLALDAFSQNRY